MLSEDIVKRYQETVGAFKSVNQVNKFQIDLGHALTPLEMYELLQFASNKDLPAASKDWLKALQGIFDRYRLPLVPHTRVNIHEGVTLYKGRPQDGQERHLLVAFTGDARRLMVPIFVFLQECNMANLDVLLLADHSQRFYLDGIQGFAPSMDSLIKRIKSLYDRRGQTVSMIFLRNSMGTRTPPMRILVNSGSGPRLWQARTQSCAVNVVISSQVTLCSRHMA